MAVIPLLAIVDDGTDPPANTSPRVPSVQSYELAQGEDAQLRITFRRRSGDLKDLTGCTFAWSLKTDPVDASQDKPAAISRPGYLVGLPAAGTMYVDLVPADTLALPSAKPYKADGYLTDAAGKRWRVLPLSPIPILGSAGVPNAPLTIPVTVSPNAQNGIEAFAAESTRTITLGIPFATTAYKIYLTPNDSVSVFYTKISVSQFSINATAPFTGEVSWRAEP